MIDFELLREILKEYSASEIELATVESTSESGHWIYIHPGHVGFWTDFRERYDPKGRKATRLDGSVWPICPEFPTFENLIRWLYECTGDARFLWVLYLNK